MNFPNPKIVELTSGNNILRIQHTDNTEVRIPISTITKWEISVSGEAYWTEDGRQTKFYYFIKATTVQKDYNFAFSYNVDDVRETLDKILDKIFVKTNTEPTQI